MSSPCGSALVERREDRLVVVVFVVEEIGAARREVGPQRVFARDDRLGLAVFVVAVFVVACALFTRAAQGRFDLEGVHLDPARIGAGLPAIVDGGFGRRRGRALLAFLFFPFAKRENAGPNLRDRHVLVVLLDGRREPVAHRDFWCLTHVREEVLRDRELGDLFVMQRLARMAEHLRCSFDERHVLFRLSLRRGPFLRRASKGDPNGRPGRTIDRSSLHPLSARAPPWGQTYTKRVEWLLPRFPDRVKRR